MSQKVDGMLIISRGSTSNIDPAAELLSSGHSQIRVFNLSNITANGYTYDTDGMRLGWGLRNSVGVAEHPTTGGIFSVENSVDQATRDGLDVHEDNPGEEMNFHGYLNGTEYAPQGSNYGYPYCFAAWAPSDLPDNSNLTVGSQFAIGDMNSTINDTYCAEQTAPRLTFEAHMYVHFGVNLCKFRSQTTLYAHFGGFPLFCTNPRLQDRVLKQTPTPAPLFYAHLGVPPRFVPNLADTEIYAGRH